jgi:hypothetical protein
MRLSKWDSTIECMHIAHIHDISGTVGARVYVHTVVCINIYMDIVRLYRNLLKCTVYDASAAAYRIGPIIKMHSLTSLHV